jgi:hypothetical protein
MLYLILVERQECNRRASCTKSQVTPLRMMLHANHASRPPHDFAIVGDSDIWMFCTRMIEAFICRAMHFCNHVMLFKCPM